MPRRLLSVLILLSAVLLACSASAKSLLVDKLLAVLGTATITASDVEVEKKILFYTQDALLYPGKGEAITNREVFHELLVRELIFQQAVKMGFETVDEALIQKRVDDFAAKFNSDAAYLSFLQAIEYADERFDKKMESNVQWRYFKPISRRFKHVIVARQFVDKKIGLNVRLSLPSRFEEQKGKLAEKFPGRSEEELKKLLEARLMKKGLESYIRDQTSRAKIKILEPQYANILD